MAVPTAPKGAGSRATAPQEGAGAGTALKSTGQSKRERPDVAPRVPGRRPAPLPVRQRKARPTRGPKPSLPRRVAIARREAHLAPAAAKPATQPRSCYAAAGPPGATKARRPAPHEHVAATGPGRAVVGVRTATGAKGAAEGGAVGKTPAREGTPSGAPIGVAKARAKGLEGAADAA